MRIICKNCSAVYEIDPALIPPRGKKVRCTKCGEVFVCFPDDLQNAPRPAAESAPLKTPAQAVKSTPAQPAAESVPFETPAETASSEEQTFPANKQSVALSDEQTVPSSNEQTAALSDEQTTFPADEQSAAPSDKQTETKAGDAEDIFKRLSEQTEELFRQEQQMSKTKVAGLKLKHILGLQNKKFRHFLYFLLLVVSLLLLYYFRYGITRRLPFMASAYSALGIKAVIPGEGLEFQNISRREFEDDYVNKTEVKGFIANISDHDIKIPTIRVELLDKEARPLQEQFSEPPVAQLDKGGKIAFSIVITKPSPLSKYVYLTFTDEK